MARSSLCSRSLAFGRARAKFFFSATTDLAAVTESTFATAATWSYGLAAAAYVVFALRLALGWRPSSRAALLMAATVATALWAAGGAAVAEWPLSAAWPAAIFFDALRYAIWFAFLGNLVKGAHENRGQLTVSPLLPRWAIAFIAAGLVATLFLQNWEPLVGALGVQSRTETFGVRLALAIVGLILIEQLIRRAHPQARWAIKPLCVGLAGVFGFDLFFFADAMLFGLPDPDIWIARAIANALVIPFFAVATARNTGWTIEMHVSRGAVFQSTALLVSGAFLLAVAGAGYFVRYVGGDWGRALQIEVSFAALLAAVLLASSGSFRSKLKVFVSKHFFSFRYDYREEWLRFTRTLSAEGSLQDLQESSIKALADLVESPGGALWLRHEREGFQPAARLNVPAVDATEPLGSSLAQFLERTGWLIDLGEYASSPAEYSGLVLPDLDPDGSRGMARRSAALGRRAHRLRRSCDTAGRNQARLGSARPAQDGEPAGRELSRTHPRHRSAPRDAQVRCVQPDVGVRRP